MPYEIELFYIGLAIAAATIVGLSVTGELVKYRLWLSEPMVCTCIGLLAGPFAFDWLPMDVSGSGAARTILTEAARVTLAVAVIGATLRLPEGYVRAHARELAIILGLGMVGMCLLSGAAAWVVMGLSPLPALLLGASVAPTDPVLAAPVLTGRLAHERVPERVGNLITMESASNDGAALPLLMLPGLLLKHADGLSAFGTWLVRSVLWEVGIAVVTGIVIGWLAARIHLWSRRQPWTEPQSLLPLALAVALAALAVGRLLHSDGLLACFVAGLFLNGTFPGGSEQRQLHFRHAVSRFFDLPFFILVGAALPLAAWADQMKSLLLLALVILLFRRLPLWFLLARVLPSLRTPRDAAFAGWFGPIGASTVFYVLSHGSDVQSPDLWPHASFLVAASLLVHGVSSTPLAQHTFPRSEQ